MADWKKEARKQYFHYFRFWFIIVGILLVLTAVAGTVHFLKRPAGRENNTAPAERVYDYADILTNEEEEELRRYIAGKEEKYGADFVVMTFSAPVEGEEALQNDGVFTCYTTDWETNMTDIADNFWDVHGYGYNKGFEGDGSILIDNRYRGQRGEWLSTSGKVEDALGRWDVEEVLYAVDRYYDSNPYRAYRAYIDEVCSHLDGGFSVGGAYYLGAFVFSAVVAGVYASAHLGKNRARDTVAPNAYVVGGKPVMRSQTDDFIRKNVVTRRIETSSGGGSGRSAGGGGGHHVSRSGASHGGGGHRH